MRFFTYSLIALLSISLLSCNNHCDDGQTYTKDCNCTGPRDSKKIQLSGTVYDVETGEPIVDVEVTCNQGDCDPYYFGDDNYYHCTECDWSERSITSTNTEGIFLFGSVQNQGAVRRLEFTKSGYQTLTIGGEFLDGKDYKMLPDTTSN